MDIQGLLGRRKEKTCKEEKKENIWLKMAFTVLKTSLLAVAVTIVLFFITALVLYVTGVDDGVVPVAVTVIRILSVAFAGFLCGRFSEKSGWLAGMLSGFMYVVWSVLIGLLFFKGFEFDNILIADVITSIIAGAVSGIIGINIKKK